MLNDRDSTDAVGINVINGERVKSENIEWVFRDHLAAGKISILAGVPGAGKTMIAMWIAAATSAGGVFPDGSRVAPGLVFIHSTEDGLEDTLAPRLRAAGANMANIRFIHGSKQKNGKCRRFAGYRDLRALELSIHELGGCSLLIVDPILTFVSGNTNNLRAVREGLEELKNVAERNRWPVLGLTHLSKGSDKRPPLDRIVGSQAFGAVPRAVMIAAKVEGEAVGSANRCGVLVPVKVSNGTDGGGWIYEIKAEGMVNTDGTVIRSAKIDWISRETGTAESILRWAAGASVESFAGKLEVAMEFLRGTLAAGPMPFPAIKDLAVANGIAEKTLRRAREQLGVISQKQTGAGPHSPFVWSLAESLGAPHMFPGGGSIFATGQAGMSSGFDRWGLGDHTTQDALLSIQRYQSGVGFAPRGQSVQVPQVGQVGQLAQVAHAAHMDAHVVAQQSLLHGRPMWMSESDWRWAFDGFQKEMTQVKRRDGEDELEYQDRAACHFLEASCPDWDRQRKEIARALVDAFNQQSPPIDYKAYF